MKEYTWTWPAYLTCDGKPGYGYPVNSRAEAELEGPGYAIVSRDVGATEWEHEYLPALVNQPSAFTFHIGDRVMRTYPLALLACIGITNSEQGTVIGITPWVVVDWDSGIRTVVNPAYLRKLS